MILVVDDDPISTRLWCKVLERMRHTTSVATSGAEALTQLATEPVDLIVTSMVLPDIDGLGLIERIMAKPYLRDVPVIVCTGTATESVVTRAIARGVADFLLKPIRVDRLAARLDRALRRVPVRWERRGDVIRRLQLDAVGIRELLVMTAEEIDAVLGELTSARLAAGRAASVASARGGVDASYAAEPELDRADALAMQELDEQVLRLRRSVLTVGAVRCASLIDQLWHPGLSLDALVNLIEALTVERTAFSQVLSTGAVPTSRALGARLAAG